MPVKIATGLPATEILSNEGIFLIPEDRAQAQDIRPLKILILNLMPLKTTTEVQLLRLLGNSPLQIEIELMHAASHLSRNAVPEYLDQFYTTYDRVKEHKYDGLIITGAPVEQLPFEQVDYWPEMAQILQWSRSHVYSTLHICWGALAGLYYHHRIDKTELSQKLCGVFKHYAKGEGHPLLRGFDDVFYAPHSRYSTVLAQDFLANANLDVLADSPEAGIHLAAQKDGRQVYILGHGEYDRNTLAEEYARDTQKGLNPSLPLNYFPEDNPNLPPAFCWRGHQALLFNNWLNFIYQNTPYDVSLIC